MFILFLEIGVNLRPNSIIKYDFLGSWRSTINEKIRVGFTTTNPKGFLLGFFSNISGEYLTLMVSNSGHLRVIFDFGFERREIIFQGKHFALGQYHDVRLSRKNSGATMVLQVCGVVYGVTIYSLIKLACLLLIVFKFITTQGNSYFIAFVIVLCHH